MFTFTSAQAVWKKLADNKQRMMEPTTTTTTTAGSSGVGTNGRKLATLHKAQSVSNL